MDNASERLPKDVYFLLRYRKAVEDSLTNKATYYKNKATYYKGRLAEMGVIIE